MLEMPSFASMLDPTFPNLVGVLIGITLLRAIAPISLLYTAWNFFDYLVNGKYTAWPPLIALQAWCLAETLFFLWFLAYRIYLQNEAIHPPIRSKAERQALFRKVQGEVNDPARFATGWFRGAKVEDIGRDEVRRFLDWSFWEGRAGPEDDQELEEYVDATQKLLGQEFPPTGKAKSLRLTLDPVEMDYRSLLWYGIIMGLDTMGSIDFWQHGFQYYRTPFSGPWVFPPRVATPFAAGVSPAKDLGYWYKQHTSQTRLPVVFLHGVGIGLQAYVEFLSELDTALNGSSSADDKVGIMAIEFMAISSRLTHAVPRRAEFLKQMHQIFDKYSFEQVVLVNHSYGSIASSHILTDDSLSARISSVLMIDPVTILLHLPDVAYNFTIRKPKHANEWQLWYFASMDPGIAHTLGRHLFWYESVLWRDRIVALVSRGMNFTVSLSKRDLIVDTPAVAKYLLQNDKPDPIVEEHDNGERMHLRSSTSKPQKLGLQDGSWKGQGLEVLFWEQFDHAQVMDDAQSRKKLIDVVCVYSGEKGGSSKKLR